MPDGIVVVIALFILAVIVAVLLPMSQKAATDPFVDMPPERAAYIDRGLSLYNKFSDTNDVTKGNYLQTWDPATIAAGDEDLKEVSQTSDLVADGNSVTGTGIEVRGPTMKIAQSNRVFFDTEKCEKMKGRDTCSKLGSGTMSGCGVCIKGGTSYMDPDNPGKHIGGMLMLNEDKQMAELAVRGTSKQPVYEPTVGECPPGYFFVDRAACEKAARREDCKEIGSTGGFDGGRTIEGKPMETASCAAVPSAGADVYVYDPKGRQFGLVLRVVTPGKTGTNTVTVSQNGAQIASRSSPAGTEFTIAIPNVKEGAALNVSVSIPEPYTPYDGASSYRAVLLQWESADGSIMGRFEPSIASINGQGPDSDGIFKMLRKYGTFARSNIILLPRAGNMKPRTKILQDTQWIWSAGSPTVFNVGIKVPGTFLPTVYPEDRRIAGINPLVTEKSTFEMLRASPCLKPDQKPGKYGLACLKTLFVAAGGVLGAGTISRDGLENLNKFGSAEAISAYLDDLFRTATRGKKESGMKASMTEINDASMKMFGFELVSPCEDIMEGEDGKIMLRAKTGGVEAECLDYLWMNTGNDRTRGDEDRSRLTSLGNTYVWIFDRYSGLRAGEGTRAEVAAKPFTACQRSGTMSPIDASGKVNHEAMRAANAKGSIQAIQNFYSDIHRAANYNGGNAALRGSHDPALEQCYGIKRSASNDAKIAECPKPSLLTPGSRISMSSASAPSLFMRHAGYVMWTHGNDGSPLFRNDATFKVVAGIGGTPNTISLESVNFPGFYVVHMNFRAQIYPVGTNLNFDGRRPGRREAEWKVIPGINRVANTFSLESNFRTGYYLGKVGDTVQIAQFNGSNAGDLSILMRPGLA
jgi:hypothetical protein